jgi:hypothetical protein
MNKEILILIFAIIVSGVFAWATHDFFNGLFLFVFFYLVKFAVSMLRE